MKILLTGATGYIGKRLLPVLLEEGHEITCAVRDKNRLEFAQNGSKTIKIFEVNFLQESSFQKAPKTFDVAFFLMHSMATSPSDFEEKELKIAKNFLSYINLTTTKQIIYLSGISNEPALSPHLQSRKNVESILKKSKVPLTVLRAGIVVGSGSASFEIIRDLVEKIPIMVCPKWVKTRCQPIAVRDVIQHLKGVMLNKETFHQTFDIGGPEVLTYREMLLQFAAVRGLQRKIIDVPVLTPRLSSYWLYFVTSTSYPLAVNLVNSMKVEVVCKDKRLETILGLRTIHYKAAVRLAFDRIEQDMVLSSWKDSLISSHGKNNLMRYAHVPVHGCLIDHQQKVLSENSKDVLENIWSIGGNRGWYYGNFLWKLRGDIDKMVGGVGLRRGRTNAYQLQVGEALDFWRVLVADKTGKRLLLYAEMKLPGEAWLQFKISKQNGKEILHQKATFRPKGIAGRLYWYLMLPFHHFIFNGMINGIVNFRTKKVA
ncbi:SDR family oxidoreductase [Xanthovirga aplysinae]|uniref:SDR family oxidoreductase n=1 Tax=Xanthovirga aplysinae TaxID=2529853 RepID=UPI0012BC48ED|nr:SDR family oxidoreductase [Xanthovirga aplysinae]MTI31954.1 SDR family oxidoreductase [Xanthovirga aplysinae]